MKKYYQSWMLVLCAIVSHAQSPRKLDSLRTVLAQLPPEGRSYTGDTARVRVLCEMGEECIKMKKDSALVLGQQALWQSTKISYKLGEMRAYILVGKFYYYQSLRIKSSEYFFKALAIAELYDQHLSIMFLHKYIGDNYHILDEDNKAIYHYRKHIDLCRKYGTKEAYLLSFNNLGLVYYEEKKYQEALKFFRVCEKGSEQINSPKVMNVGLINVAMVLTALGRYDEALARYDKSLTIDDGYNDRMAFIHHAKADIYLKQNQLDAALNNGLVAHNEAKKAHSGIFANVLLTLSNIYQKRNETAEALKFYRQHADITFKQDSIKNNQIVRFMNLDYENEKQTQQITTLNFEVERQQLIRNIALVVIVLVLAILGITYFFYRSLQKKNRKIEQQNVAIEELNATLEQKVTIRTQELLEANEELIRKNREIIEALFKGQTIERKRVASELHDNLGGTLSAIKWRLEALDGTNLTEKEKGIYNSIVAMMKNAYADVRHISHNLLPAEFEEKGLIGAIEKLCNDVNQSEKLQIEFIHSGDFNNIGNSIALELYSTCMELVNNILKHSGAEKAEIILNNTTDKLQVHIKDNGRGLSKNAQQNGVGLKNIQSRIQAINGLFSIVEDEDWGTKIMIELPLA